MIADDLPHSAAGMLNLDSVAEDIPEPAWVRAGVGRVVGEDDLRTASYGHPDCRRLLHLRWSAHAPGLSLDLRKQRATRPGFSAYGVNDRPPPPDATTAVVGGSKDRALIPSGAGSDLASVLVSSPGWRHP